jgi:hypothetical protein
MTKKLVRKDNPNIAIVGTLEIIQGVALIDTAEYSSGVDGAPLVIEYFGQTDIDWDGQKTVIENEERIFVDESGEQLPESQVMLIDPELVYPTYEDAEGAMLQQVDDPCIDNIRFAYLDDKEAMALYEEAKKNGCCGFCDLEVIVAGRRAMIGCNYGH